MFSDPPLGFGFSFSREINASTLKIETLTESDRMIHSLHIILQKYVEFS